MQAANPATDRIPRARREALARQDAPFVKAALVAADPRSTEAHLRHTALLLRDRQAFSPSARAVAHVTELFEKSVPAAARARIACASGCSFCCHQPVFVSAPEAFFLASRLRSRPEAVAAVTAAAEQVAGRGTDRSGPWLRCPLLAADNGCSVYAARPLSCHAEVSTKVEDCRTNQARPGTVALDEPPGYRDLREHCRLILLAALRINGLATTGHELNAAVHRALTADNAEKRWLRGEAVFAGLPVVSPLSAQAERMLAFMAANISPTL